MQFKVAIARRVDILQVFVVRLHQIPIRHTRGRAGRLRYAAAGIAKADGARPTMRQVMAKESKQLS